MSVTPLSKYLALFLFIAMPFLGFYLGVKYEKERVVIYHPTIVERVFEKEVIVEKAGTSTPEVKIIIFSGNVREGGQNKCMVDGVCSTMVSEYEVIWSQGWQTGPRGTKDVVKNGDRVEVFGRVIDKNTITLYGNENYYLKKVAGKENDNSSKERGDLVIVRNEGGLCVYGVCWSQITLFTDGTWEYEDGRGIYDDGNLQSGAVSSIVTSVANTDFEIAKSHLFTETCPIAHDGQKTQYTFYTEIGLVTIDSCEADLTKTPLFGTLTKSYLDPIYKEIAQ